jgi:hypothetical protein
MTDDNKEEEKVFEEGDDGCPFPWNLDSKIIIDIWASFQKPYNSGGVKVREIKVKNKKYPFCFSGIYKLT